MKRLFGAGAAALVTACGGGDALPIDAAGPSPSQAVVAAASHHEIERAISLPEGFAVRRVAFPGRPGDAASVGPSTDEPAAKSLPARAEALELTLYNPSGASSKGFRLASIHGQGYPTLRALLQSPHLRKPEPAAGWSLRCESAVRCTYRALRRGDANFTVELSAEAPARLSADDGAIVISATRISVPVDTTLTLQWWRDGSAEPSRRAVTYLAPPV